MDFRKTATMLATSALLLALAGCGQSPSAGSAPTSTPTKVPTPSISATPTSAPTAAPNPVPEPPAEEVTFTYTCYWEDETGMYIQIDREFQSWDETWSYEPATVSCSPIKHGTEYTDIQREAVAVAGSIFPLGIEQLDSLYAQCAVLDNGYIKTPAPSPTPQNWVQDVSAFLTLCPDRPGADYLRALVAAG